MSESKRKTCRKIIKKDYRIFLKKKNVVGVGFGYKITNGIYTKEACLKIFVSVKEPPSSLAPEDIIPEIYEGFKTDVVQTGELVYSSLKEKNLPLQLGYSIGPANVKNFGSAGCVVKDCYGNLYILSCNHVLSYFNTLPIGTPVLHPSLYDHGKYPDDLIAILSKTVPILSLESFDNYRVVNSVDCAIAKILNPSSVKKQIAQIGKINGIKDAELNLQVKKVARTTELTNGTVIGLDCVVSLEDINNQTQLYQDQIVTTYMSTKGDSGSIGLDYCNNAIGLLFANGDSISIFNPIKAVLTALNVCIVNC